MSESLGIADILERTAATDHADDDPPRGAPPVAADPPPAEPEDDAERVAADLRRQVADQTNRAQTAERARLDAEARAAQAATEVREVRQSAVDANYTTILSALDARSRESESLAGELASAMESGDHRKAGEISVKLGRIGAAIEGLESAKQEMERLRQERLRAPAEATPPAQVAPADPTTTVGVPREQFLGRVNPTVADWLRGHDQFFTDQSFYKQCLAADKLLEARGILPSSPDYISGVEGILGLSQSQSAPPPARPPSRGAPPAAAPPARGNPSLGNRPPPSGGDTYVSPDARRTAEWLGVDPVQYVQEQERLKSAGEIPHRRR